MQRNIGKTERILRLLLGVVICVSSITDGQHQPGRQHLARNWYVSHPKRPHGALLSVAVAGVNSHRDSQTCGLNMGDDEKV